MNQRATIVLLVLFFTGLLGLKWADYAKIPDRNQRARAEPRVLPELLDLKPDDLRRVEVAGGPTRLVFERRDGNRWQMVEPMDVAADPSVVESLAFNLKELKKARDAGRMEGKPADYGLETPTRTVTLYGADGSTPLAVLDVGSTSHEMRYVRSKATGLIDVVEAKGLAAVEMPAVRWRDRLLIRMPSFQVETLSATGPGRNFKVNRERESWRIVEPIRALGDVNKVEGDVAEVVSIKVADGEKGFVADDVKDLAKYGLDKPRLTFTATPQAGKGDAQTFYLGNPVTPTDKASRYYAKRDDQDDVVLVDATVLKDVGADPLRLHSKRVADFAPDRVEYVRLTSDSSVVEVAKTRGVWARVAPLADAADAKLIDEMLQKVDAIEASELFPAGAAVDPQVDKPWATLEVWEKTKLDDKLQPTTPARLQLKIGRRDKATKTAYCQTEGDPTVMAIPLGFIEAIPPGPLAFRDRQVSRVNAPQLEQVTIKVGDKSRTIVPPAIRSNAMAWRLKEPIDAPADPESLGRLFVQLSNLRAETLVTAAHDSDTLFGLDKPYMTVTWKTRDEIAESPKRSIPGEKVVLTVGNPTPGKAGGRYARLSTGPIVFTLPAETLAAFDVEWRDRLVLSFDVREVAQVTIGWPTLTLAARPVGDSKAKEPEWTLIDPPKGLNFDRTRLKPLMIALARLNTLRYTQYEGPIDPKTELFPGRLTIKVALNAGQSRTLRIGGRTADGYLYATMAESPTGSVFELPIGAWEPWLKAPKVEAPAAEATPK